ncbi:MAG: nucleoside triphosphate pyrophosphohydrolase [Xanthomonadales bacterium]|nr:nucleoside triphosphate pyrophosphohydrolase [Xanthomonadales bacterium]
MTAKPSRSIDELLAIMARLRDPNGGCPWDLKQTSASVAAYAIEEAYELVDAIEHGSVDEQRDELGDLLFQVVLHARIAEEQSLFDFNDVVEAISSKLVRRHPHVFGDVQYADAAEQSRAWETIKAAERGDEPGDAMAGVPHGLPAWQRARKLQQRAARSGFEWTQAEPILNKLAEELDEVRAEFAAPTVDAERAEDEIGDMLFVLVNLSRVANLDFERALRRANAKFEQRFRCMVQLASDAGDDFAQLGLAEQQALWVQAKKLLSRGLD